MEKPSNIQEKLPPLKGMKLVLDLFGGTQIASYVLDDELDMYVDVYKLEDGSYVKTVKN